MALRRSQRVAAAKAATDKAAVDAKAAIDYPSMEGTKTKKKGRRGSSTSPTTRRCSLQSLARENEAVKQLNVESTNFPLGCTILVKGQHPTHGGKVGIVQGHTTVFIWVLFETSKKTVRISPRFLLLQANEVCDDDARSETNELTISTLTPRRVSITPSRSTVTFNVRDCFASYNKDDPPNVVTTEHSIINSRSSNASNIVGYLPEEIDVTRRNEELLAEWDDFSDDFEEDDDDDEEEDEPILLYGQ
jgi:hypothetical protein